MSIVPTLSSLIQTSTPPTLLDSVRGKPSTDLSVTNIHVNSSGVINDLFVRRINGLGFSELVTIAVDGIDGKARNVIFASPPGFLQVAIDEAYALSLETSRPAVVYASPGLYPDTTLILRNRVTVISESPLAQLNLTSLTLTGQHGLRNVGALVTSTITYDSSISQIELILENCIFEIASPCIRLLPNLSSQLVIIMNNTTIKSSPLGNVIETVASARSLTLKMSNNSEITGSIDLQHGSHKIQATDSTITNVSGNFVNIMTPGTYDFFRCIFGGQFATNQQGITVRNCSLLIDGRYVSVYSGLVNNLTGVAVFGSLLTQSTNPGELRLTTGDTDYVVGVAQSTGLIGSTISVLIADPTSPLFILTDAPQTVGNSLSVSNITAGVATVTPLLPPSPSFAYVSELIPMSNLIYGYYHH